MKIMHIISGGDKGGAKTHMFTMLDELCKIADVTVVCLMRGVFYEEILGRSVRTVLIEQKSRMDFSVCKKISKLALNEGFDIINAHGARANFIAMRLNQKKLGIPVVTTIHSDPLLDFDSFFKKLIFMNLNRLALRKIKYKIAVTDAFREMLISRGFMPNDILTVYNGINFDDEPEHISKEEFAKKFHIPYDPDKVYIGIAARFNRVKGVDVFIRSAAEVLSQTDKARFVIIGEGEDEAQLKELAVSLNIADKIYFLGFVHEVYDFLNFIDINMLTSLSESFPYSLLEGAKAKKATVASEVGGIPHMIIDSQTGYLFESQNHTECASKLMTLINDRNKIEELGQALYKKASIEFSNKALAEKYLNNYCSFIEKFKHKKRYDIILSGYYGHSNFGDDVVMKTIIKELKNKIPNVEIAAFTKNPAEMMLRFGIDCKNRYNPFKIFCTMSNANQYICGGGTLFTDVTSRRSLLYYTQTLRMAKLKGLKTIILANGIGPFIYPDSEKKVKKALQSADIITIRDKDSYKKICEMGLENKCILTADISMLYTATEADNTNIQRYLNNNKINQNYFVISLREWKYLNSDFEKTIASVCDYIAEKYKLKPVFIPIQPEKDDKITRETVNKMNQNAFICENISKNTELISGILNKANFVLSMRLHPIIFSFSQNIPIVGISYDQKVESFISENNAGECLNINNIKYDEIIHAVDRAISSANCKSGIRADSIEKLKEKAAENFKLIE